MFAHETTNLFVVHDKTCCRADAALPYEVAADYLRAAAVALLCWAGTRIEEAAGTSCDEPNRWQAPLQALRNWGLKGFERSGLLKEWTARQAMGTTH